jgi:hypothetical protein
LKLWSFERKILELLWTTTDTSANAYAENKFIKKAHHQNSLSHRTFGTFAFGSNHICQP